MKLPDLKSKRKIRDGKICLMYLDGATPEEIGVRFKIHRTTVDRILYKHQIAINAQVGYEKNKRVHWLKRQIKLRGDSKKDAADLIAQLREEIEGNLIKGGQVQLQPIINIYRSPKDKIVVEQTEKEQSGRRLHIDA